ncbi:hypothetical protein LSH36_414g03009 [Paralvinella palmiformis]|uniref:Uncharacterized protein n=1 Tax=Paralvinella palmiformis TaxID=53620 RepID=A0AAD9JBS3_9ANNE|nr:hypothetical protein LSH36_414g03009 [Paralvinella palmiformis]
MIPILPKWIPSGCRDPNLPPADIGDPGDIERKRAIKLYHSDDSSHDELLPKQLVSRSRDTEGRQPIGRDLHSQLECTERMMKRIIEMLTNQLDKYKQEDDTDEGGPLRRQEKMVASNKECIDAVLEELQEMSQDNKRNLYAEIKKKDDTIKKTEEKLHGRERKIRTELRLSPTASEREVKKKDERDQE